MNYLDIEILFDYRFIVDIIFCFLYCFVLNKKYKVLCLTMLFILHNIFNFLLNYFLLDLGHVVSIFYFIAGQILIMPVYSMLVIYSLYVFSDKFSSKKSAYRFMLISTLIFWFISTFIVRGPHLHYYIDIPNRNPPPFFSNGKFNSMLFYYSVIMNGLAYLLRYIILILFVKIFANKFSFSNKSLKTNLNTEQTCVSNNVNSNSNSNTTAIQVDRLMNFDIMSSSVNFEPIMTLSKQHRLFYIAFDNTQAKNICLDINGEKIHIKPSWISWRVIDNKGSRVVKRYASLIDESAINVLKNINMAKKNTVSFNKNIKNITTKDKSLLIKMIEYYYL